MSQVKISQYPLDNVPSEIHRRLCKLDLSWLHIHKAHTVEKGFLMTLETKGSVIGYVIIKHNDQSSALIHQLFVHPACRQKAFGRKLLLRAMKAAAKSAYDELYLECIKEAIPFFSHHGFIVVREPLERSHEPLYQMEMPCLRHYLQVRSEEHEPGETALLLSKDNHLYKYHSQEQFMAFHRSMMSQAQRQISILSDKITHPLFKDPYIRRCLLNLSKRNAQARIRIMLEDDRSGAGYHNPIIDLAQKLTSFIELRVIPRGALKPGEMITTVDFDGGIYRKNLDSYNGFVNYSNHLIAQRLRDNFDKHWEYAKPSANMRRLSI